MLAPDLFKAVVAIAPVTDPTQLKADALRFSTGMLQRDFIGSGAHLREGSPAQNATAFKAPVILFHGDIDINVPLAQTRLMNDKLRDAGKKVEMVLFPGVDHQLNDTAARTNLLRKSDEFLRASFRP